MNLERVDHCLICCSEIAPTVLPDLPTSASCSLLDKHLEVIFLLRKVLEVPVTKLAKYLEGCPNVEGWIRVCDSCADAVKQCKLIYQELLEANRKWRRCQQQIVGVIKVKREEEGVEDQGATISDGVVDISQATRLCVRSHEYEDSNNNPFVAGDLRAAEELQKLLSPAVKKEGAYFDITSANYSDLESGVNSDEDYDPEAGIDRECAKLPECKRPKATQPKMSTKSLKPSERVNCHICGRSLFNPTILRYHLYSKHAIGKPQHQCGRCHKAFPNKAYLNLHLEACSNSNHSTAKVRKCTDESSMPPGNNFRVKCPVPGCSQTWPIISAYQDHLQSRHTEVERSSVEKYPKILECVTCGKVVRNKRDAKSHWFTHDDALKKASEVVCEFCGVALIGKRGLLSHQTTSLQCRLLQGQTEGEATIVCDICGKRFANPGTLHQHVRAVHEKNFRHRCQHCPKGFRNKANLKVHLAQVHGIVEDKRVELKCPVEGCGKIFYHKYNWKDHQKGVHKQGEPDQKCQECGKTFYTYKGLDQHVNNVHRDGRYRKRYKRKRKTGNKVQREDAVVK